MYKLFELEERTLKWCDEKGILSKGNKFIQTLKLVSEVGELYEATNSADNIDAIGDILIVLTSIIYHTKSIKIKDRNFNKAGKKTSIIIVVGDICDNIIKDKPIDEEVDKLLDLLRSQAVFCRTTLEDCWLAALLVVEDRVGYMNTNGDFIKTTKYAGKINTSGDFEPGEPNV